jgi:hypothetical protein
MNVTQLTKIESRNAYGDLALALETAMSVFPELAIEVHQPSAWGGNPDLWLRKQESQWILSVPGGEYKSGRHYHNGGTTILAVESSRKKLNLAGCPLFLLKGRMYNGDYKSLSATYFLFGKNEDGSFFLHKVRPCVGAMADLDQVRAWIWNLKKGETVAARQGDLAFIPKQKSSGKASDSIEVRLGNHVVRGEKVWRTVHKAFVLNPIANHGEHHTVQLQGLHELRLGRAWGASSAD